MPGASATSIPAMTALRTFMFFSSCRRGLLTAYGALGVADEAYLVPATCERIEEQQAPRKGFSDPGDELDRFGRLEGADDADEGREDAHDRAAFLLPCALTAQTAVSHSLDGMRQRDTLH